MPVRLSAPGPRGFLSHHRSVARTLSQWGRHHVKLFFRHAVDNILLHPPAAGQRAYDCRQRCTVLARAALGRRDRDFGSVTSPYALGDEKALAPAARTGKWLEMAAGQQRKLVPIRLARPPVPDPRHLYLGLGVGWGDSGAQYAGGVPSINATESALVLGCGRLLRRIRHR